VGRDIFDEETRGKLLAIAADANLLSSCVLNGVFVFHSLYPLDDHAVERGRSSFIAASLLWPKVNC
jgi:hypothetical protein